MKDFRSIIAFTAALGLALWGCGESHSVTDSGSDGGGSDTGGSDGGGSDGGGTDGGSGCSECAPGETCCRGCAGEVLCVADPICPVLACPPPPLCGEVMCTAGQSCCPTCDGVQLCTDGICPDIACPMPDPCSPMDVRGEGACRALLGWFWDGASCTSFGGCECVGADCYRTYDSQESCEAATNACVRSGRACGTRGASPCAGTEFCDFPDGSLCGAADGGGTCRPRPDSCATIYDPVCGCDGMTYGNACDANSRGVDVATVGECGMTTDPSL